MTVALTAAQREKLLVDCSAECLGRYWAALMDEPTVEWWVTSSDLWWAVHWAARRADKMAALKVATKVASKVRNLAASMAA
jgi:hypothetical protein